MKYRGELRASLLLSIGVGAVACGATTTRSRSDESAGGMGGSRAMAGAPAAAGSAAASPSLSRCTSPIFEPLTGLVECAEGYVHRLSRVTCQGGRESPGNPAFGGAGAGGEAGEGLGPKPRADREYMDCWGDERACAEYELGYCDSIGEESFCASGCRTDEDCGPGYLCECGYDVPGGGKCVEAANCAVDADCAGGYLCASFTPGCGARGFACQSARDECQGRARCQCSWGEHGDYRACDDTICGRPFLVASAARVAPIARNGDWATAPVAPRVEQLAASERARRAAHFARLGQLEHASIAAFARFQLQLLALGAPPELVEACARALEDETRHAKQCFALASRYRGEPVGPGPLDVSHSLGPVSLLDVVELVIVEGCAGETSAALEAHEAAQDATDPVIRDVFARIAADEQRHAELAFRFVRWALERDVSGVHERLASALASDAVRSSHGRDVVEPCLKALYELSAPLN